MYMDGHESCGEVLLALKIRTNNKAQITAHESLAAKNGINRGQQVPIGILSVDVTSCAHAERLSYQVGTGFLRNKDYLRTRDEQAHLLGRFDSIQRGQADIE